MSVGPSAPPDLGSQMRAARMARGIGLRSLATQVGMSPSSLSEFEHGKSRPRPSRIEALSVVLDIPVGDAAVADRPMFSDWRVFEELDPGPVARGALELFVERGYHGSTIRMIAERSGLTVAGVYHHVPSKQDLLQALMRQAMSEMVARCEAAEAEANSSRERLTFLVESLTRYHLHRMDWGHLATNEIRSLDADARAEMLVARRRIRQMVQDAIDGCRTAATQRTGVPHQATARAIVTMCVAIPDWYDDAGRPDAGVVVDEYVSLALAMVDCTGEPCGQDR